jgi:hypothetical protein
MSPPAPPVTLTVSEWTPAGTANAINPGVVSVNESALATGAIAANATTGSSVVSQRALRPSVAQRRPSSNAASRSSPSAALAAPISVCRGAGMRPSSPLLR